MSKKVTLLGVIFLCLFNVSVFAQSRTVTLDEENTSIRAILKKIELRSRRNIFSSMTTLKST